MREGRQAAPGTAAARTVRRAGAAAWLIGSWLGGASGAYAADPPAEEPAERAGKLQEVIVHARRREEALEDTPVAISARSGEELREANAVVLADVARDVPNVRMVSSPQSVSALDVTIRGQTVNRAAIVFDPAVGIYVDGVYVASGQGAMATLLDVDSVEVMRGSQGTLFGRNNTGGSILVLTHRPDLQHASAEAALSGGDYGSFMGRAILNVPVTGDFAMRFAYQSNDREGFGSSVGSGQDNLQNQHRYQARFGALYKPDQAGELYFTYERFEANENGAILHPLMGPAPGTLVSQIGAAFAQVPIPGLPTVSFPTDPYKTDADFHTFDHATTDALQLTGTQRFEDGLELKMILGYRHVDANTALDVDATTLPLANTTLINTSNQRSAELVVNGKTLADRLDLVGGMYYFKDNGSAPSVQAPASPAFLAAVGQFDALTQLGCLLNPPPPPATCPPPLSPLFATMPVYEQNAVTNTSAAAYVHGEYQLTSHWAAAAGLRRTEDSRELQENSYVIEPNGQQQCTILDGTAPPLGPCPLIDKNVSYGYWSWEFSTRYRFNPELNSYLRIGRSQRSGGWNAPLSTLQDQPFRPEQLTDYELGLKADVFGGALVINGDVFYGQYEDMQRLLPRLNPDGTPVTQVINAGKARLSGAELETQWQATAHAALQASFGWLDARYQTFMYTPIEGAPPLDLSGNEFQAPRYQAFLGGSYVVPTAAGDLSMRADYAWQDRVQFNIINDFNNQGSYGTVNGRIAFGSHERTWELALYGNNLADTHYAYTGGTIVAFAPAAVPTPSPAFAWQIPGARRTFALEGTYRWNPIH